MVDTPKISVCLIVKNEERFIENCLRSVASIASEIVIVDTGSTDKTIQIASKYTDKIYFHPWNYNFAEARNYAISLCKSPFILSIDADEELQNPETVLQTLSNAKPNIGGWLVNNISFASRKSGTGFDTFASKLLRIFRNHSNIRFEGIVHEQIHESILQNNFEISDTEIIFLHYGYSLSENEMRNKQLRNLSLLLKAINKEPTNAYLYFQTAKTYLALDKLVDADHYIEEALKFAKPESATRPQTLNYGGIISFKLGDFPKAIQRARESLKLVPNQSFANFVLGETYSALTDYKSALLYYQEMEKVLRNPNPLALFVGDYFLPFESLYFRIGRCYIGLNQYKEAETYFRKGLAINPNDFDCIRGLSNALIFQNIFDEPLKILQDFKARNPNRSTEVDKFVEEIISLRNKFSNNLSVHTKFAKEESSERIPNDLNKTIKPFITLSMIVKNEEKYLPGCLESVKDLADEIIIVDTGSTDNTKKIAQSYGAKIFDFPWKDDFSIARNEALKHSTGEWIIYLDADERIVYPPAKELINLLKNADSSIGAFYCLIESEHYQMDGSTELHRGGYPRIFRNLGYPRIKFVGRVHEQIAPSIFQNGLSIQFSDIKILHLGYNESREVMERKIQRNYKMLIEHVKEEPLNGYAWFQLGQTLAQMSLFNEAEKAIRMAIQTKSLSKSVFASAASTLAKMVGNKGYYQEALYWAEQSLSAVPDQIYALHLKAYALLYLERYEEAENLFYEVLNRIDKKKGIPLTGFDIIIPEHIVLKGLEMAKKRIKPR
ncbi:MAG: glycosyltransferase [Ignavibacteria bacterium]|nr:glycosyltransferase [Ignavibacteria bacterium]